MPDRLNRLESSCHAEWSVFFCSPWQPNLTLAPLLMHPLLHIHLALPLFSMSAQDTSTCEFVSEDPDPDPDPDPPLASMPSSNMPTFPLSFSSLIATHPYSTASILSASTLLVAVCYGILTLAAWCPIPPEMGAPETYNRAFVHS